MKEMKKSDLKLLLKHCNEFANSQTRKLENLKEEAKNQCKDCEKGNTILARAYAEEIGILR